MRQQSLRVSSKHRTASIRTRMSIGILCLLSSVGQVALAADGDPDSTFSSDGMRQVGFAGSYTDEDSVQVGSDAQGGVFIATKYRSANIDGFTVLKIKPNGDNDTTFGFGGYGSVAFQSEIDELRGVFPQPDGSLVLLGVADTNPDYYPAMAKLTANGNNDSSFGDGGRLVITQTPWVDPSLFIEAATQQADGKFLFVGSCDCAGNNETFVLRTSANGVPDPSFGINGWASFVGPSSVSYHAVTVDRTGRAVLAGRNGGISSQEGVILRVTPSGALDTSFGTAGSGFIIISEPSSSYARAIAMDSNDAMVVALVGVGDGTFSRRTGLARFLANGDRDLNYAGGHRDLTLEFGSEITSLQRRSDGRMVAAGWIDHTGDSGFIGRDFLIARVLPNGALDSSFDGNGLLRISLSTTRDTAEAMVLSAGKPVIAGISEASDVKQLGVLRMQSDLVFSDGFQ